MFLIMPYQPQTVRRIVPNCHDHEKSLLQNSSRFKHSFYLIAIIHWNVIVQNELKAVLAAQQVKKSRNKAKLRKERSRSEHPNHSKQKASPAVDGTVSAPRKKVAFA